VEQLLDLWLDETVLPRAFGDLIEQSEFYTFVESGVAGIAYIVSTGPSFPYQCAANEITTKGTLSLTQV